MHGRSRLRVTRMSYIMCNTVHISDVVCVVHVMYVASVLHNVRVAYVCHVHAYIGTCWYVYIACEFHVGHMHCIMCGTVGLVAITCYFVVTRSRGEFADAPVFLWSCCCVAVCCYIIAEPCCIHECHQAHVCLQFV